MPQPLAKKGGVSFEPATVLQRPLLASRIAVISGIATHTEMTMGSLLTVLLGAEAGIAATLYTAIENDGARMAVLKAIAARGLKPDQTARFDELLKKMRKRAPERNTVVHGVWGASDDYADALIWMDPRDFITYIGTTISLVHKGVHQGDSLLAKALVYTEKDLADIQGRLNDFRNEMTTFLVDVLMQTVQPDAGQSRAQSKSSQTL